MSIQRDDDPRGLTRRGFLGATAAGGAMAAGLGWATRVPAQPSGGGGSGSGGGAAQGTRVRRNVYDLARTPEGQAVIAAYRQGVKAMMAKPYSDVTSWRFQAAIHLPNPADAADFASLPIDLQNYLDPANLCQHGNGRFLPWHRMYVYYFERIVRKASGLPAFALPYWNYSDSSAENSLPEAFRNPAGEATNALFRSARRPGINTGGGLPSAVTGTGAAMQETTAGPTAVRPGFYRQVESQPHNLVHVALGGDTGLMSDPTTAALDPIFWLHHCNIDRLWTRWMAQGRTNLNDATFLNRVHRFWDEDGNPVTLTTREVMDTISRLDYRYDDATAPEAGIVVLTGDTRTGVEAGPVATVIAAAPAPVTLSREGVTAEAQPLVEAGGPELLATRTPADLDRPVVLQLENIQFDQAPRTIFEVYLNAPEDSARDMDPRYFAGLFAPFAPPREGETLTEAFNVSGLINRQIEAGIYDGGPIAVRIVPRPPEPAAETGVEAGPLPALPEVTVGRVAVVR